MRACKADSDGTVLVSQAPTWRQALSCLTCVDFASSAGPPNMPCFEIDGDPIRVAYGYDLPSPGVFLSVYDKRLTYDPNASDQVNHVTESIGVGDGGGSYFDLHTGAHGFGIKVDGATMATYLRRFGVPDTAIAQLPLPK